MERLTEYTGEGQAIPRMDLKNNGHQKCMERLAEYEDLEEQCAKENSWCLRMLLYKWKEFIEDIQELYEYRKAEEQNRLLKLPCAVGNTVYTACSWGIESGIVGSIEIISDRIFVNNTRGQMIGEARNIFLTREEAEAALEELERGKGE